MPRLSRSIAGSNNVEVRSKLEAASSYLRNMDGSEMTLSNEDYEAVVRYFNDLDATSVSNVELAQLSAMSTQAMHSSVRNASFAMEQQVRAVGNLVEACHADTVMMMNLLQDEIAHVNGNVNALGENVATVARALASLQAQFNEYIRKDAFANEIQRAETKLVQIDQKLESDFGHNKELRRTAVGMLEVNDLAAVRVDTILTSAEELCISTPRYWLAPALVALSQWIQATRGGMLMDGSVRDEDASMQSMRNMLNEAYVRDREKTALFFGLICRRANHISEANEWFKRYISFQSARKVNHTCIVLLNAYASGIMGHGVEEQEMLQIMAGWLDELIADPEARHEEVLLQDWKNQFSYLSSTAKTNPRRYQALPEFAPQTYVQLQQSMQATYLHGALHGYLDEALNLQDFKEDDLRVIDTMINDLVTSYDSEELPLRREQEYQNLIIQLDGDRQGATLLRGVKDDMLTETKSFLSVLSDAARGGSTSTAMAATRVMALKIQMPWIKTAYEQTVAENHAQVPAEIPFAVGDFSSSTVGGENEEDVVSQYVEHVNAQEREALSKTRTGTVQKVCLIGGAALAVIGFIMTLAHALTPLAILMFVGGLAAGGYGLASAFKARRQQRELSSKMQDKRLNGTIVIRKIMQEAREWRAEYSQRDLAYAQTHELIDNVILNETGAASAFFGGRAR